MSHRSARPPRVARPLRILLAAAVILGVAIAGFLAGWTLRPSPEAERLAAATQLDAWAPVEERAVGAEQAFTGTATPGVERAINLPSTVLGSGAVVLEMGVGVGETIEYGQNLAMVSGQPYYALPEPLALYRDLRAGDTGKDVESLQMALAKFDALVTVTGVVDYDTMQAVERLYLQDDLHLGNAGAPLSDGEIDWQQRVIRKDAFIPVPPSAVVIAASQVAQTVTEEAPLLQIREGQSRVEAVVDVVTTDSLQVGDAVVVEVPGQRYDARVVSVGEFQAADDEHPISGKPVTAEIADPNASVAADAPAKLIVGTSSGAVTLAVPLIAVRTNDAGENYVIARNTETPDEPPQEVLVSVERTGSGYAAVRDDSATLTVSYEVKVS